MPSIAVPVALNSYGASCYLDRKGKRKPFSSFFSQIKISFDVCETVSSEQNSTNGSNAMVGSLCSEIVSLSLDGIIDNNSDAFCICTLSFSSAKVSWTSLSTCFLHALLSTPWDALDGFIRLISRLSRQKPVEISWTSQVHRQPGHHRDACGEI